MELKSNAIKEEVIWTNGDQFILERRISHALRRKLASRPNWVRRIALVDERGNVAQLGGSVTGGNEP